MKVSILNSEKNVSPLQMSLTLVNVLALVLANILTIKSIDLFGLHQLANTCGLFTFPITYVLSDVFSEVYGYKWSRTTATWAFLGTTFASIMFAVMIAVPGNAEWTNQQALETILGNTPQIAFASVLAFWCGDLINDRVFRFLKSKNDSEKLFPVRAIASSIAGKYVDDFIFTFVGLAFMPLELKIIMFLTDPWVQIVTEVVLLPVSTFVMKKVKGAESGERTELGAASA